MWKLIEDSSILDGIAVGDIITNNPVKPVDQYKISSIGTGFVKAIHSNGKTAVKIFPEEELIKGKWCVKR